jgi:hypothetical protein
MAKRKKKTKDEHYVDNKEFTKAIVAYAGMPAGTPIPEYIGESFLKMAEGLSHRPNFRSYSWREDMVMDGVENCIEKIGNYNPTAQTRSGNPNPFGYFTQIIYWAFLRRIARENKQRDIKDRLIANSNLSDFMDVENSANGNSMMERMKSRRESL